MSHFEDEEDFEIEFSDLPPDENEKRSISGQLVDSGSRLFSSTGHFSEQVMRQSSRVSTVIRTWLLGNFGTNNLAESNHSSNGSEEDFELEFTDLADDEEHRFSGKLLKASRRQAQRVRVWRLTATACTVGMVLFLLFSSFPSPRNWFYTMVVPPTPTAVTLGDITIARDENIQQGPIISSWQTSQNGTAIPSPITPGPMPEYMVCPAPPVQNTSSTVGNAPVLISGFAGPTARVYLASSIPAPSFPSLYGFPVPLQVEVPANYTGTVILEGKEMSNDMDVMFGFSPFEDQMTSLALDPLSQDSNHYMLTENGITRIAWNITVFLPAADCYTLKASWPNGQSYVNFLAGR